VKPPQFKLRFLLVLVRIAAVVFGAWRFLNPPLLVTEKDARSIELGMADHEVMGRLGRPEIIHHPKGGFAT
jgi:HAMP domain-containing protein